MVVNTDKDFTMKSLVFSCLCVYLSLSVDFHGGLLFVDNADFYRRRPQSLESAFHKDPLFN